MAMRSWERKHKKTEDGESRAVGCSLKKLTGSPTGVRERARTGMAA